MDDDKITWTEPLSSRVSKIGYDAEQHILYVVWAKSGRTSAYMGVPADVAEDFSRSWSVGSAVNTMLAGYEMSYVG